MNPFLCQTSIPLNLNIWLWHILLMADNVFGVLSSSKGRGYSNMFKWWISTVLNLRLATRRHFTASWNTCTAPRPSQRPIDPPTWSLVSFWAIGNVIFFNPTSDKKLLRVGVTRSVLVILIFVENPMSINPLSLLYSWRNLVRLVVVVHGKRHFDTRLPSNNP